MYQHIITPIDAEGRVGQVLNSYLYGLNSLERVVMPHRLSMAAHSALVDADAVNDTQYVAEMGAMLYHLMTLATSLQQLAACLLGAQEELEVFLSEGADFEWFAHYKQSEATLIASRAGKKSRDWQAKFQSLASFQLRTVLAYFFTGAPGGGERIGASRSVDFSYYSALLRNPSQLATLSNITTRRLYEAIIELPAEQPDERWDGYDVSLSGPEAAAEFEALLQQCHQAAALYHGLAADDGPGYKRLFQLLTSIIDGVNDVSMTTDSE